VLGLGLLTVLSSPDKLLLTAESTIKVPVADASLSFVGFMVVVPFLLLVLTFYLHIFFGYWLDFERERQHINQRLIPPIESIPTLFSLPDTVSRLLTAGIFYWLVPLVFGVDDLEGVGSCSHRAFSHVGCRVSLSPSFYYRAVAGLTTRVHGGPRCPTCS
jgi:hypothetical protein